MTRFQQWCLSNAHNVIRNSARALEKFKEMHPDLNEREAKHQFQTEFGEVLFGRASSAKE